MISVQYRSAIFYLSESQHRVADSMIAKVNASVSGQIHCDRGSESGRVDQSRGLSPRLSSDSAGRVYLSLSWD